MGRPTTALISKQAVIEAALAVIDGEGINALSIRRLGRALEVNGASLYHHFKDKDEILRAVRRLVLSRVRLPESESISWQEWCVQFATTFRAVMLEHPNTAPLMVSTNSRQLSAGLRDVMARILLSQGVPPDYAYAALDSFSTLAFGSVLFNVGVKEPAVTFGTLDGSLPNLREAVDHDRFSANERFDLMARALAAGWSSLVETRPS